MPFLLIARLAYSCPYPRIDQSQTSFSPRRSTGPLLSIPKHRSKPDFSIFDFVAVGIQARLLNLWFRCRWNGLGIVIVVLLASECSLRRRNGLVVVGMVWWSSEWPWRRRNGLVVVGMALLSLEWPLRRWNSFFVVGIAFSLSEWPPLHWNGRIIPSSCRQTPWLLYLLPAKASPLHSLDQILISPTPISIIHPLPAWFSLLDPPPWTTASSEFLFQQNFNRTNLLTTPTCPHAT